MYILVSGNNRLERNRKVVRIVGEKRLSPFQEQVFKKGDVSNEKEKLQSKGHPSFSVYISSLWCIN